MATAKTLRSKTTHSLHTQTTLEKRISSDIRSSGSRRKSSFADKPTPLDFDTFIPWVCCEWQVPEMVTIIRMAQGLLYLKYYSGYMVIKDQLKIVRQAG